MGANFYVQGLLIFGLPGDCASPKCVATRVTFHLCNWATRVQLISHLY